MDIVDGTQRKQSLYMAVFFACSVPRRLMFQEYLVLLHFIITRVAVRDSENLCWVHHAEGRKRRRSMAICSISLLRRLTGATELVLHRQASAMVFAVEVGISNLIQTRTRS